jgi:4-phospho-D-threonate 3-dehydrogenase / 4-phospho-D-erythronate 3-dehydrogenase
VNTVVAATIGDPCGVGPEVIVHALGSPLAPDNVLLIGCAETVERAVRDTGSNLQVVRVRHPPSAASETGLIHVLDDGLYSREFTPGQPVADAGRAVVHWWNTAVTLAEAGDVGAVVKGPVSKEVIKLGCGELPPEPVTYLLLITGTALRVAHLSDHVPLGEALTRVTRANLLEFIRLVHKSLRAWGIHSPRIAVAGLNPHAQGREEREEIEPAVRQACADGIKVTGPFSPDTVFRQGIQGENDCIIAHYHDQGHIAVKTWKFDGNCALNLGSPFIRLSVPHGPAYDIAGQGIADSRSMLEALRTAAALAAGRGFPTTME